MTLPHWLKLSIILLYVFAIAWVISYCQGPSSTAPPPQLPKPPPVTAKGKDKSKDEALLLIEQQARERDSKRQAHEQERAREKARHLALEADLRALRETDLPAALKELTDEAIRYKNKASDLTRLTNKEQWDRETPLKRALTLARELITQYYAKDKQAQKGRDGPTLHLPEHVQALQKRLETFRKSGDDPIGFAAAVAQLVGKVPDTIILASADAIARAVLPPDALNPCRDPAACPPPAPPPAPLPAPKSSTVVYCADPAALRGRLLSLYEEQGAPTRAPLTLIEPGRCGIAGTGREHTFGTARTWVEVTYQGITGWARASYLKRAAADAAPPMPAGRIEPSKSPPPHPELAPSGPRYCVDLPRGSLPMHSGPDRLSPHVARIPAGTCGLAGTGRRRSDRYASGPTLWYEIIYAGQLGWVPAHNLVQFH